jgi:hypothetical protein
MPTYAIPPRHSDEADERGTSQSNTRGTLDERSQVALRDHHLEEEVFARQTEHMEVTALPATIF